MLPITAIQEYSQERIAARMDNMRVSVLTKLPFLLSLLGTHMAGRNTIRSVHKCRHKTL